MTSFDLDEAGTKEVCSSLREIAAWTGETGNRFASLGGETLDTDDSTAFEDRTYRLRLYAVLPLLPHHPRFAESLRPLSLKFRKQFLSAVREQRCSGKTMGEVALALHTELSHLLDEHADVLPT